MKFTRKLLLPLMVLWGNCTKSVSSIVAILLCAAMVMIATGCTPQQQADSKAAVAKIATYLPEIDIAVDTVVSVVATFVPADATLIQAGESSFDASVTELKALCSMYAATPNTGTLASIQSALQQLLTTNASQFLAASNISNPVSVAAAKTAIAGVRVVLLLMDGVIQTTQTPAQTTASAQARVLKLKEIEPYLTASDKQRVEEATGHSFRTVYDYETAHGF